MALQAGFMVMTRTVRRLVESTEKVGQVSLSPNGQLLAWVEGESTVYWAGINDDFTVSMVVKHEHKSKVSTIRMEDEYLLIGDELEGVTHLDASAEIIASWEVTAGVQQVIVWNGGDLVLDGMGQIHHLIRGRESIPLGLQFGLQDVVHLIAGDGCFYVAQQNGKVLAITHKGVRWERPRRGEIGEHITGMGITHQGHFFLTREGHAMVEGEEEAIEFECWANDQLLQRVDLRMRLLTSSIAPGGAILGFDNGEVHRLSEDGNMERILETRHPIFSVSVWNEHVIASSWFFVHGTDGESTWKVEHQGMPQWLEVDSNTGVVYFGGDDQNDFTDPEPVGCLSLTDESFEVDPSELSLWFELSNDIKELSAEDLYGGDQDDMLSYLTEEERQAMQVTPEQGTVNVLLDAMGVAELTDELPTSIEDTETPTMVLDEQMALMNELTSSIDEVVPPTANAGDDQRVMADGDGTCIVLLDGTQTHDPDQQVQRWSWIDGRGKELATTAQLRLKLSSGVHSFELRVVDANGGWTSDRISVTVVEGSTS